MIFYNNGSNGYDLIPLAGTPSDAIHVTYTGYASTSDKNVQSSIEYLGNKRFVELLPGWFEPMSTSVNTSSEGN